MILATISGGKNPLEAGLKSSQKDDVVSYARCEKDRVLAVLEWNVVVLDDE